MLLARHGRLVLEEYFYGFDRYRTHDMRSAAKTITGTMVGAALDHGARFTLQTPVRSLFRYPSYAHPDPRKARITAADLLTMSSGLDCDDNDDNSPGNEDRMYAQSVQLDYYKYALDLPMARDPGTKTAVYCTAGINLLGGVLRNATGQTLVDLFQRYFADPLGISTYHINLAPNGDAYMGGGLYLQPRDILKLGQLYLDRGVWNGRRVVSAAWVDASVREHSAFPASAYAPGHGYGYAWHLFTIRSGDRTYGEYMAQGNGGQILAVLPGLDATVLILAGNYGNFPTWRAFFERDIPELIAPALR
ncbi:MAG: serine hydrolase [Candidatus Eremiobacteraeota bacterium]|nr:serine hydrolase [Candidatus Eremiobacteraeota bacterium]